MIPHILTSQYQTSAWTQWDNESSTNPVLGTRRSHTPTQLNSTQLNSTQLNSKLLVYLHQAHRTAVDQLMDCWEGSIKWCIVVWSKANTCLLSTDKMERLRADLWCTATTILTWRGYTASFSRTVKMASLLALLIFLHNIICSSLNPNWSFYCLYFVK